MICSMMLLLHRWLPETHRLQHSIYCDQPAILFIVSDLPATISTLRSLIATQCDIPIHLQQLTRVRRPWFTDPDQAAGTNNDGDDDFPDANKTVGEYELEHGDMIFLSTRVPSIDADSAESSHEPSRPTSASIVSSSFSRASTTASRPASSQSTSSTITTPSSNLSFPGWVGWGENLAEAESGSQQQARTRAMELMQQLGDKIGEDNPQHDAVEELKEIIRRWMDTTLSNTTTAAGRPASVVPETVTAVAPSQPAPWSIPLLPLSAMRPNSDDSTSIHNQESRLDDDLITSRASDAHATNTPSADDLQHQLTYWQDRYARLRVKAEKMNSAGMALKRQLDETILKYERSMEKMRGKVMRRDARILELESMLNQRQSSTQRPASAGRKRTATDTYPTSDGRPASSVHVSRSGAPDTSVPFGTLGATSTLSTPVHHRRPGSAGRSRPLKHDIDPSAVANDAHLKALDASPFPTGMDDGANMAATLTRRVRPHSASRSRPSVSSSTNQPFSEGTLNRLSSSTRFAAQYADDERKEHASIDSSPSYSPTPLDTFTGSRNAMRHASVIDASKQERASLVGMRNGGGPLLATHGHT